MVMDIADVGVVVYVEGFKFVYIVEFCFLKVLYGIYVLRNLVWEIFFFLGRDEGWGLCCCFF